MAQDLLFTPYGGLNVKKDTSYTAADIYAESDVVFLTRGVRITDEVGDKTSLRGVRLKVSVTGLTPPTNPTPPLNIPIVWVEGTYFAFVATGTYTFLDDGIVAYGKRVAV